MNEKLLQPYDPKATEERVYALWERSGYFSPEACVRDGICDENAPTFSMVLPPPNVTGTLHTGHALTVTIEDVLTRYHRMRGKRTLWLPGTDHAAIATQSKVEKELVKKEKKNRHDLGREAFLERVNTFAQESHDTIVSQLKRMGTSLDWEREAFTLDEPRAHAVRTAFKRMYDDGLIYRGLRIVNWDPKGQTTVSDDEVVYVETTASLYTFRYSKDFPIPIATTRPETKVGDTGVAVHPDDPRYKEFIGKEFSVMFADVPLTIRVVGDEAVDPEYGTGAVGVTPAHSKIDFEIAQRHNLPAPQVINEYAKMTVDTPELAGKKTTDARKIIVEWLKENDLLEKEESIAQNLSTAERSGGTIEPLPKVQWFIDVNKPFPMKTDNITGIKKGDMVSLREIMRQTVENGQIEIIPERFRKVYFHWIENLHDWCISRQIWYGHRVPVWYRDGEAYCGIEAPKGDGWEQDPDTLDTWFSSGLWTFSTLGWPEETVDLSLYHPTDVLETGYDILPFWVARMILMAGYHVGNIPFRTVYMHGMVRDAQGRKMSKSLGNVIDPVDMIEKYGTDALRMALVVGNPPGSDLNLAEDKIRAYKKFANKIWNATRFVLTHTEGIDPAAKPNLTKEDTDNITELDRLTQEVTEDIEHFRLHLASEKLYHYFWHTFADIIIERSKEPLGSDDALQRESAQWTLLHILTTTVKLLHPFMPFVTEEIWSLLPHKEREFLLIESWPTS